MDEHGRAAGGAFPTREGSGRSSPDILAIAEGDRHATVEGVLDAVGCRNRAWTDWRGAVERLNHAGSAGIVVAEARGVGEADLVPVLPLLDAFARGADQTVIVVLDFAQIDLISATLAAPGIALLCAPTLGEYVAALFVAGVGTGGVRDSGREAEAERLRQLHEQVARIAETLARLTGETPDTPAREVGRVGEHGMSYRAGPGTAPATDIAARDIRDAIRVRRLRDQHFSGGLFEDPAWDMLLDLFAAELERAQVSVSSLCIAAAVAPTTALRWIAKMTEAGLFERQPDPFDRRRAFMALSPQASAAMRAYVAAARRISAAIA
jgi:hypothetical protein